MKLLSGENTEAKATSKTIPSFSSFVNIIRGISTLAKVLWSSFITSSSGDPTVSGRGNRLFVTKMSKLSDRGRGFDFIFGKTRSHRPHRNSDWCLRMHS